MTSQVNTKFWEEFITIYKSHPSLWNKKRAELYTNKHLKKHAHEKLLQKLRDVMPKATLETLKRKINTLRGCYRRELKKVRSSERTGFDIYVPTLWYFEQLSFLRSQETQRVDNNSSSLANDDDLEWEDSKSIIYKIDKVDDDEGFLAMDENTVMDANEDNDNAALMDIIETDDEFHSLNAEAAHRVSAATTIERQSPIKERRQSISSNGSNTRHKVVQPEYVAAPKPIAKRRIVTDDKDDISTLSAAWGVLFRKLTPEQQLYANKTIMGVLYQGALGNLDQFSYKIIDNEHASNDDFQFEKC